MGPRNRKARKILVFARCLLFFSAAVAPAAVGLPPLSCRQGTCHGTAAELTAANGCRAYRRGTCRRTASRATCCRGTCHRAYRRTACRRACRRGINRRAYRRTACRRRGTCQPDLPPHLRTPSILPCILPCLPQHWAVGPTAPSGGKRSGRRRPPPVCPGVSLPGLWPLGQGL